MITSSGKIDGEALLLDDQYRRAQAAEIKQLLQLWLYTMPHKQWFVSTHTKKVWYTTQCIDLTKSYNFYLKYLVS
jgi:hypothetical protein